MTNYNPDNWVVIKMNGDDLHYRDLVELMPEDTDWLNMDWIIK
jgi:hypothetical protein